MWPADNSSHSSVNIAGLFRFIIKDRDTFFTPAQRSMIAHEVLMRTRFDDSVSTKFGW